MPSNGGYLAPDHNHEHPDDDDFIPRESSPDDFLDPVEIDDEDES